MLTRNDLRMGSVLKDLNGAEHTVPASCKQYGVPFFSKYVSEMMSRLQKHNFKWENEPYDVLVEKYPKCKVALKWWCNTNGEKSCFNISKNNEYIRKYREYKGAIL